PPQQNRKRAWVAVRNYCSTRPASSHAVVMGQPRKPVSPLTLELHAIRTKASKSRNQQLKLELDAKVSGLHGMNGFLLVYTWRPGSFQKAENICAHTTTLPLTSASVSMFSLLLESSDSCGCLPYPG
ncbi:mCG144742, partial [Mus musculus]